MNAVSLRRLARLMRNDLLSAARPALYGTASLLGLTVIFYLVIHTTRIRSGPVADLVIFGMCLIGGGLGMTSMAFQDMHHPLERNRYLMLPVSNLERILSRYLLTGPLFVAYAMVAFVLFDHVGKLLVALWLDRPDPLFNPFAPPMKWLVFSYLLAHAVTLVGALCFRRHALLKTILFLLLVILVQILVENVTGRIFFPGDYTWSQFGSIRTSSVELIPWFAASWMNFILVAGIYAWLLYLAYQCLRDHEA